MVPFWRTQRTTLLFVLAGALTVVFGASMIMLALRRDLLSTVGANPFALLAHVNGGRALARLLLISVGGMIVVAALAWPRRTWALLTQFFGAEGQPLNLAVLRIVLFAFLLSLANLREIVFYSSLPSSLMVPPRGLSWLPQVVPFDATTATIATLLFQVFCVLALVGFFTRFSALMVALCGLYVLGIPQFFGKVNHYHHLIWFAALLAITRSGDALSVDALFGARRRADKGNIETPQTARMYALPLRFMWLLIGIAYFFPGFWKFWTSGFDWILTDNLRYQMYTKWVELGGWTPLFPIDQYPVLYRAAALATICFEIGFIFFVLFPKIRPLFALGGLTFHTMTGLFMRISFLPLQVCYVAFFDWYNIFGRIGRWLFTDTLYVVYDGNCELCRRTIASLRVFDLFRRITYVNALDEGALRAHGLDWLDETAMLTDMHAVRGREVATGYDAYRALAWRIPLLWPLLPFLALSPIRAVGEHIYRRVAHTRACRIVQPSKNESTADLRPSSFVFRPQIRSDTLRLYAITALGVMLIVPNLYFGANRVMAAWPFACYPTFDSIKGPQMNVLEIETEDAAGQRTLLDRYPLEEAITSERWQGLARNVLDAEPDEQSRRLAGLWQVLSTQLPSLEHTDIVRFYKATISTIPSERAQPPIKQELLVELHV